MRKILLTLALALLSGSVRAVTCPSGSDFEFRRPSNNIAIGCLTGDANNSGALSISSANISGQSIVGGSETVRGSAILASESGSVGIKVSPNANLHVGTGNSSVLIGSTTNPGATAKLGLIPSSSQTNWQMSANTFVLGAMEFTPSTTGGGTTFTTPSVILNSGGNVSIGTTTADALLTLGSGNVALDNQSAYQIRMSNTVRRNFMTVNASDEMVLGSNSSNMTGIGFQPGAEEKMFLGSTGNLGIKVRPNANLHIGTGSSSVLIGSTTAGGNTAKLGLIPSSSQTNWQMSVNTFFLGALEFTPSTAGGGTTFTTPAMIFDSTGKAGFGETTLTSTVTVRGRIESTSGGFKFPDGTTMVTAAVTASASGATWTKYTKTFSDFSIAQTSNSVTLVTTSTGTIIQGVKIKHSAPFTGGAISAYTISVGTTGADSLYASSFNVFNSTAGGNLQLTHNFSTESDASTWAIRATANSTGANLSAATLGSVDIWILSNATP